MNKIIVSMALAFAATNINAQLVVDSLGRVGVGTIAPESMLSVGNSGLSSVAIHCNAYGKREGLFWLQQPNRCLLLRRKCSQHSL